MFTTTPWIYEFNSIEEINWKQSEKCIALKSFNLDDNAVKQIVYEIKLHQEADFNGMIKFYGTKAYLDKKYLLVIEYAEGGTLRNYLEENLASLDCHDKYRLAHQLSSAVEWLHEKEIIHNSIHNDLHSNNIFIQQNSIKLADPGLSKRINDARQISFDTIPYIDPEGFNNSSDVNLLGGEQMEQIEKYTLNEKSDVYSVGVLFWELSSRKKPFTDKEYDLYLAMEIVQGLREIMVEGTPKEYFNLYTKCWDNNPNERSTIQGVVITLKSMMSTMSEFMKLKLNSDIYNRNEGTCSLYLTENNFSVEIGKAINEIAQEESSAQEYINRKYPTKVERKNEIELTISNQYLEGHLDLSDFVNLEKLNCSDNQLTSLDISKNTELIELDCSYNKLTNIKLPLANNEKLEYLNLLDNEIFSNLSCFSRFINVKQLFIGNTDEDRIEQGIYNQFHGSLEPLKNLVKLERLRIDNTDIGSGLEYLPGSVEILQCLADIRPEAQVRKIYEQLEIFAIGVIDTLEGRYNLKAWKKNWELVKVIDQLITLGGKEIQLETDLKDETSSQAKLDILQSQLTDKEALIIDLRQKNKQQIDELRRQLEEANTLFKNTRRNEDDLRKENERLSEEHKKEKKNSQATLENQLKGNETFVNELKGQLKEADTLLKESEKVFQKEKRRLLKEHQKDKDKLSTLESQLKSKMEFINNLKQTNEQQIDKLNRQLEETNNLLEEFRRNEEDFQKEKYCLLEEHQKEVDKLESQLKIEEQQIDELKRQLKETNTLLEEFGRNKKDFQKEKNRLLEEYQKDMNKLESQLKIEEQQINELKRQLKENEEELQKEKNRLQDLITLQKENQNSLITLKCPLEDEGSKAKNTIAIECEPSSDMEDMEKEAKKWIEDAVQQKVIKSIPQSEFETGSIKEIGSGSYGSVVKAYWTNSHRYVACKKLTTVYIQCKFIKHELHMQIRAHGCENIIRILGISENLSGVYAIVMEYADEGNLTNYLSKNFKKLDWNKKIRLALDITNGLHYLHKENILHRDLHAGNIVIHQGKAKITDFGNSKSMNTATNMHDSCFGNIRYVAPEIFKGDKSKQDPYTKYSDVYSLGVLLWQISSGKTPFEDQDDYMLFITIMSGSREKNIPDTPDEYYNLYNGCWNDEPEKRYTVEYVYNVLEKLKIDGNYCNPEENINEEILSSSHVVFEYWHFLKSKMQLLQQAN